MGGRLIIASDGVWDALSSDKAADCCRGLTPELAARQVVKVWKCFLFFLHIHGICYVVFQFFPIDSYYFFYVVS